jgi:hypothetical protein
MCVLDKAEHTYKWYKVYVLVLGLGTVAMENHGKMGSQT